MVLERKHDDIHLIKCLPFFEIFVKLNFFCTSLDEQQILCIAPVLFYSIAMFLTIMRCRPRHLFQAFLYTLKLVMLWHMTPIAFKLKGSVKIFQDYNSRSLAQFSILVWSCAFFVLFFLVASYFGGVRLIIEEFKIDGLLQRQFFFWSKSE